VIIVRRAGDREHRRRRKGDAWSTFPAQDPSDSFSSGFGHLRVFEEGRLPPSDSRRQPIEGAAEIITYVHEGTLAFEDSTGRSGILLAGEFQRMTAGRGIRYGAINASSTEWAHVFQIWLQPSMAGMVPGHEQKRFTTADRRGVMCVVASPDGQNGSLQLHQDATLISTILDQGQHVIHALSQRRCAWVHVVQGAVRCGSVVVATGDGAGIRDEASVSLTATETSELLVLDLGERVLVGVKDEKGNA
jgi:redox-sensitive bicupin YhaK (pirin superfamily)